MRRGYLVDGRRGEPARPIDIDYEAGAEKALVEVLARLDEIGDVVDGQVNSDEIQEMLQSLPG